ncbi:MAG: hypothetical protein COB35_12720 [Gammaproteobacteria bacterium]|nr:MAG: hypothetical protein COB35_12720 [Gammaproteobacteria bacterium]
MKNKLTTLLYTQNECETLLLSIAKEFNKNDSPTGRIYLLIIEETYRNWTEILKTIYKRNLAYEPWNFHDEKEMMQDPKKIPTILLKTINKINQTFKNQQEADHELY